MACEGRLEGRDPYAPISAESRLDIGINWTSTGIMGPGLAPRLRGASIRDDKEQALRRDGRDGGHFLDDRPGRGGRILCCIDRAADHEMGGAALQG